MKIVDKDGLSECIVNKTFQKTLIDCIKNKNVNPTLN